MPGSSTSAGWPQVRRTLLAPVLALAAAALPTTAFAGDRGRLRARRADRQVPRTAPRRRSAPTPYATAARASSGRCRWRGPRSSGSRTPRCPPRPPRSSATRASSGPSPTPTARAARSRTTRSSRSSGACTTPARRWRARRASPDADIDAPEAWSGRRARPPCAWRSSTPGINFAEPDLAPNIATNPGESGGGREHNGVDDDGNGFVDDWRGWDFVRQDNDPSTTTATARTSPASSPRAGQRHRGRRRGVARVAHPRARARQPRPSAPAPRSPPAWRTP